MCGCTKSFLRASRPFDDILRERPRTATLTCSGVDRSRSTLPCCPHRPEAQDVALSRPKRGFESRWGRHASQCRQVNHARNEPLQRDGALERVSAPTVLDDRREPERTDEQRPEHLAAALDVPRQQSAPVGQLRSEPLLEVRACRWRRDRRVAANCSSSSSRRACAPSDGRRARRSGPPRWMASASRSHSTRAASRSRASVSRAFVLALRPQRLERQGDRCLDDPRPEDVGPGAWPAPPRRSRPCGRPGRCRSLRAALPVSGAARRTARAACRDSDCARRTRRRTARSGRTLRAGSDDAPVAPLAHRVLRLALRPLALGRAPQFGRNDAQLRRRYAQPGLLRSF